MDNEKRIAQFREHMKVEGIGTSFIFNPDLQFYLTGFRALLYSRPIVLVIDQYKSSIIIPGSNAATTPTQPAQISRC